MLTQTHCVKIAVQVLFADSGSLNQNSYAGVIC